MVAKSTLFTTIAMLALLSYTEAGLIKRTPMEEDRHNSGVAEIPQQPLSGRPSSGRRVSPFEAGPSIPFDVPLPRAGVPRSPFEEATITTSPSVGEPADDAPPKSPFESPFESPFGLPSAFGSPSLTPPAEEPNAGGTSQVEPHTELETERSNSIPIDGDNPNAFDFVGGVWCAAKEPSTPSRDGPIRIERDCGEDGFYISRKRDAIFLGLADGVGGWSNEGVDPRFFSWGLMNFCQKATQAAKAPIDILKKGYNDLLNSNLVRKGSSTVALMKFDKIDAKLSTTWMGDSLYLIVRDGQIYHKSKEQMIMFNMPVQLSADFLSRGAVDYAKTDEHELKDGDIVIVASDGLFDNSYGKDIMETVDGVLQQHGSNEVDDVTMTRLAEALGTQAKNFMFQDNRLSPFGKGFKAFHQREYMGGKKDDVTIMAYRVVKK